MASQVFLPTLKTGTKAEDYDLDKSLLKLGKKMKGGNREHLNIKLGKLSKFISNLESDIAIITSQNPSRILPASYYSGKKKEKQASKLKTERSI